MRFLKGQTSVLVAGFPAGSFATNCYVLADRAGADCIVVDPGQDAVPGLAELLAAHRLRPAAVLLTHGHLDHTWSVAEVCDSHRVAAWIHPADRAQLTDPGVGLGPGLAALLGDLRLREPAQVRELVPGAVLTLAGLELRVHLTPGHTPGSVTFSLAEVALCGDLIFAGSVGRTDLPGGDHQTLLDSCDRLLSGLSDETVLLPGHGPSTTVGAERATNPFLAGRLRARPGPGRPEPGRPASVHPASW